MHSIEHAIPAYVPEARVRITHYVLWDYPIQCGDDGAVSETVPCAGLCEALTVIRTNRRIGMLNVRVVKAEAYRKGAQS